MKIAILTAILGDFDTPTDPVEQSTRHEVVFHRFTDKNFPPITGLTPRLQYRIPKLHGWQMFPDYDVYIWLDGSMSFTNKNSVEWLLDHLRRDDIALFKHPWRSTVKEEVDHIEEYLKKGNEYIVSRYKNGLHKEQYEMMVKDPSFVDDKLFASNVFIYRNTFDTRHFMMNWWYLQSRFYTCDQVNLPYALHMSMAKVNTIEADVFKNDYITLVSHHK